MSDEIQKYCTLAAEHLERGEPEEALQWYDRALALAQAPFDTADVIGLRGQLSRKLGEINESIHHFDNALGRLGVSGASFALAPRPVLGDSCARVGGRHGTSCAAGNIACEA